MKKTNLPSLIFAAAFLVIAIFKWSELNAEGILVFGLVVLAFAIMGIAPLFTKKK